MAEPEQLAATLVSIAVTPKNSSIPNGKTEQFTAMGTYSDGSIHDITATATWASSATGVGTIAATGLATSVALGSTTITATSGGVSASATLTIVNAQHTHITSPIIMNTPLGHLKFRQSFVYDTPQIAAGPDPHQGHITNAGGSNPNPGTYVNHTFINPPKPQDALQPILEIRADIPAPRFQWGQEGALVKDPAYPIKKIVEAPTTADSTSGIWTRGKAFAGNIPKW